MFSAPAGEIGKIPAEHFPGLIGPEPLDGAGFGDFGVCFSASGVAILAKALPVHHELTRGPQWTRALAGSTAGRTRRRAHMWRHARPGQERYTEW
jgi:hypothetical protein